MKCEKMKCEKCNNELDFKLSETKQENKEFKKIKELTEIQILQRINSIKEELKEETINE